MMRQYWGEQVATVLVGRPVSGALNWSARLERRALKAQLSIVQHRAFAKRLSLNKNIMDFVCASNTAYGSGLIFKQYTDLVIGMLGFFSSVLGGYRAWLMIFPWEPRSRKVDLQRRSLLNSPRPIVDTPAEKAPRTSPQAPQMTEEIPAWKLKRPPPPAKDVDGGDEDEESDEESQSAGGAAAAAVKQLPRAASEDQLPRLVEATGYASDREGDDDG